MTGKKYRHLFFDLDHTLWDFEANARTTLETIYEDLQLRSRGVDDFERFYLNYLLHNERLWERYRKGFIKQEELRLKRMRLALLDFKIANEELTTKMSAQFIELLPTRNILFPHTTEILQYLSNKNYELHLITNGFEKVQHNKLKNSGLDKFFGEVITSEGSNSLKPNREIFDYALRKTGADVDTSIMLGDTPEVDIQGAINAGMDQVLVNHTGISTTLKPTYMVSHLKQLEEIF
ncbi:MAG: YjjG family noncanonical pyrimidine nucleotidase [Chitinophagaceae bacterium]